MKKEVKKVIKKPIKKVVSKSQTKRITSLKKEPVFKIKEIDNKVIVSEMIDDEEVILKEVEIPVVVKETYPIEIGTHPLTGKRHLKREDGSTFYE